MNLPYVVPRVVRHFLPENLTRFLLLRSVLIKPGLETADPQAAVKRYLEVLQDKKRTLVGQRVLVFGYGGRFDVGVGLLNAGAAEVILCEKFALPDDSHNRTLIDEFGDYLQLEGGRPVPRPGRMALLAGDIQELARSHNVPAADIVLSNSVYEHLQDAEGTTEALAALTQPDGLNIHFVDLRDHFFRYPFEMLTYSERSWRTWLNPTSNHNRLRLWDYRRYFAAHFGQVEVEVLQRDAAGFGAARRRIRPEFVSGDPADDCATLIRIVSSLPRSSAK